MKFTLQLFLLLTSLLLLIVKCHPDQPAGKSNLKIQPESGSLDSVIFKLKACQELSPKEILLLNTIDTNYSYSTNGAFCDTIVQINDSIFYSVISLSDTSGICSFYFIVTIDEKNKKAVDSRYFQPGCDVDYASDSYELYDYKIVAEDSIRSTKTIVYQKENRCSPDESENIEREETKDTYFVISPEGKIRVALKK
jgi:hypothetical protein